MNPYEPPRGEIEPKRLHLPIGRSPAERAFDLTFLPLIPILIVLAYFKQLHPAAGHAAAVGAAIYWFFCVTKVLSAWRDPGAKVLRLVSATLLVFEAFAIVIAFLK